MASKEKDKPLNRDEAILMIAKALGLKTDLGKKPIEKKNKGGLTGNMKKKLMAKPKKMNMGGYGTATKKMSVAKPKATKMMGGGYSMKKKK
mgnify:CR=1 FL=1|jgi:hypothetical protein